MAAPARGPITGIGINEPIIAPVIAPEAAPMSVFAHFGNSKFGSSIFERNICFAIFEPSGTFCNNNFGSSPLNKESYFPK